MTFEEMMRDIRARRFQPIYFLHGEEPYFIDAIEAAIEETALSEGEKGFNQTIVYGKDVDSIGLLDTLRRYPMMSERQVVILREAQEMKGLSDLMTYMEKPMLTTLFVVCFKHKKYDLNTKFGKALKAGATVFESKKLYDNQIADWLTSYCKSKKLQIEPAAAALMAEYLGTELSKAANEVDKLALNLSPGAAVGVAQVQEFVGISKEYNVYELQKAIAVRDMPRLARIQQYFASNMRKNPLIVTISSLYAYFSKVYMLHFLKNSGDAEILKALDLRSEWFLKEYKAALPHYSLAKTIEIIGILRDYDLRAKGVNNDNTSNGEEALMLEMFYKILH